MLHVTIFYFHSFAKFQHGLIVGWKSEACWWRWWGLRRKWREKERNKDSKKGRKEETGCVDLPIIKTILAVFIENMMNSKQNMYNKFKLKCDL